MLGSVCTSVIVHSYMYCVIIADNLYIDIGGFAGSRFNAFVRNDDSALQLVGEHFLRNRSIFNSLAILASTR